MAVWTNRAALPISTALAFSGLNPCFFSQSGLGWYCARSFGPSSTPTQIGTFFSSAHRRSGTTRVMSYSFPARTLSASAPTGACSRRRMRLTWTVHPSIVRPPYCDAGMGWVVTFSPAQDEIASVAAIRRARKLLPADDLDAARGARGFLHLDA